MYPALDLQTITSRTTMPSGDVVIVEQAAPGFTVQRIATQTSWLYSRLRKRYAKTIPFGQSAPPVVAYGSSPPVVWLQGHPTMGALQIVLQITTAGAVGTAAFKWSQDGGVTWTTGVSTAATVTLGATGLAANFPVGAYGVDNAWKAATPIPEAFLDWLTVLVSLDLYWKRGSNPQDPAVAALSERRLAVMKEVEEAANSQTGLFDLPLADGQTTAVTTGGPMGYSEASPYRAFDIELQRASREDYR